MEKSMTKTWTAVLEEDSTTGELILPFPPDLLEQLGWKEDDTLEWLINEETKEIKLTKKG
jgi:hypothetical protein